MYEGDDGMSAISSARGPLLADTFMSLAVVSEIGCYCANLHCYPGMKTYIHSGRRGRRGRHGRYGRANGGGDLQKNPPVQRTGGESLRWEVTPQAR